MTGFLLPDLFLCASGLYSLILCLWCMGVEMVVCFAFFSCHSCICLFRCYDKIAMFGQLEKYHTLGGNVDPNIELFMRDQLNVD